MKKLGYLLILISGICNAQIVNIPDANFKAKLLSASAANTIASTLTPIYNATTGTWTVSSYTKIDSNNDGNIQLSEAQAVKYLDVKQSAISNLSGIAVFTNLRYLDCSINQLVNLNVLSSTNLQVLNCATNQLPNLNISGLINLKHLDCSINQLPDLNVSGSINLQVLNCSYNQLSNLNIMGLSNLQNYNCSNNQFQNFNLSGLPNLQYLDCSGNSIYTNLDVSGLTNLISLYCGFNQIIYLNVLGLSNLQVLGCSYNLISNLNISGLSNLQVLDCSSNNILDLNAFGLVNLQTLNCYNNQLQNLNILGLTNLQMLSCYDNQLQNLNVSGLNNLQDLDCHTNLLTNLNISGLINLQNFYCNDNIINNLNVSSLTNLQTLSCYDNQLPNLNVSGLTNLQTLRCYYNQLSNLNVSGLTNLISLFCNNNQLTNLNVTGSNNLKYLYCENNQLNILDLSSLNNLLVTDCFNNNLLTTLFIKNGKNDNINFNNTNLSYICADEDEVAGKQNQAGPNVVVNSYCSFTPGGNFNTISGNVKFDANNNGCDVNDSVQPNIRINITEPNASGARFTNNSGNYSFYTQAGTFNLTPDIENPTWFNFSPNTADVVFADNNNNVATQDFCVTPNGFHPDIEVVISPISPARPGFDATYQVTYKNKGNYRYIDGFVNLEYDDSVLDFVSTSQSPNSEGLGSIGWIFSNLLPFESRSIQVTFNVNAPTETPAVNIGDVLTFRAYSYPSEVDETPLDNDFTYNQTVVGSYYPNDITCLEGNSLPPSEIGNYLHYAINFENTGNYPAENIVVKTVVDATKFDINSLQLLATSNPVDARITGNKVEFIFQNIQLPIGGHGHVLLKVKSKATLITGDSVAKRADIFFDYNAPIDTGFANTTFQTLSNTIFETDTTINVYPNPTTSKITINSDFDLKSIQVYDVQGRILETLIGANKILDISDKANGVYFLKITTNKGSKIEKVVKK